MKQRSILLLLVVILSALCVPSVFGQATGTVKGVCKDTSGNPIAGATVEWYAQDTGRKYDIKTNAKGEYFSLGIAFGKYKVTLLKDGQPLFNLNNVPVSGDETVQDFDLAKEQAAGAKAAGVNPEELKRRQEEAAKAAKETNTVKTLNEKLAAANTASTAGDFDTAIATLTEATQIDATRDLLWFKLGDAYRSSAAKQTDSSEKNKRLASAVEDYQKAIDLKAKANEAATTKNPDATKQLSAYYNNLGDALAKSGKTDDAVKAYTQAAETDPASAAQSYFNMGAVMTNTGKVDEAIAAFDKSIAADPNRADSYYWKGVNLMGKATLKGDKMVAPEGTSEAFNKYLELQPTGQFAEPAKQMLASIGATVETQFGKQKKTKK
ncbi:MAG TPA: tetratricopeptide repeat protein [Terriglobales bacterium]|jgi:tetratricopeptide (TPR) repeat protein